MLVGSPGLPGPPRLGLLVTRRCGTAVRRNRIKRRLRTAADRIELKPGTDYVIIASSEVADAPFAKLVGWLERAAEVSDE